MKTENVDPMNTEQLKTAEEILKQQMIKLLKKEQPEWTDKEVEEMVEDDLASETDFVEHFIEAMNSFASQQSKLAVEKDRESRWISVKERLPEEGIFEVLLKVEEPFFGTRTPRMIVAYYEHEEKRWRCDITSREVYHGTHWQQLPEAPKL